MSWVSDIGDMLEDASLGTKGTNLFGWRPPESPHDVTVLIPYGGQQGQRTHSGTERRFPRLQVMCRGTQGDEAFARAEAIRVFLRGVAQVQVGSTVYEAIVPLNEPLLLAEDSIGRFPYVVNYEVRLHAG